VLRQDNKEIGISFFTILNLVDKICRVRRIFFVPKKTEN